MNLGLLKENLRRYWVIPIAGFLIYFIAGPFFSLLTSSSFVGMINDTKYFIAFLNYCMASVCGVTLFEYLNKNASCSVMHSMPFSRKNLYITNYVSGIIMAVIPMLIMPLVSLLVLNDSLQVEEVSIWPFLATYYENGFSTILYSFSIFVIAAMVCGNGIISSLTGHAFSFLIQAVIVSFIGYADVFLTGYDMSQEVYENTVNMHPITVIWFDSNFKVGLFIPISLILAVAGYFIYKKRDLEKAGDSYVFTPVREAIGFLLTFFFTTGVTIIGFEIDEKGSAIPYIGIGVALITGFIISRMIVQKTFKIINKKNIVIFGIIALVIVAIIVGYSVDIMGYEKYIPNIKEVESVSIDSYRANEWLTGGSVVSLSEKENIERFMDFHQEIIDSNTKNSQDRNGAFYPFYIEYKLKNGKTISRRYELSEEQILGDAFRKVYSLKEYTNSIDNIKCLADKNIVMNVICYNYETDVTEGELSATKPIYAYEGYGNINIPIEDKEMQKNIISAMADDFRHRVMAEDINYDQDDFYVEISINEYFTDEPTAYYKEFPGYLYTDNYSQNSCRHFFSYRVTNKYDEKTTGIIKTLL